MTWLGTGLQIIPAQVLQRLGTVPGSIRRARGVRMIPKSVQNTRTADENL